MMPFAVSSHGIKGGERLLYWLKLGKAHRVSVGREVAVYCRALECMMEQLGRIPNSFSFYIFQNFMKINRILKKKLKMI